MALLFSAMMKTLVLWENMKLWLKRHKVLAVSVATLAVLLLCVVIFWNLVGTVWTQADYQVLDLVYRWALKWGFAPESSPRIVYLNITDDTFDYFGNDILGNRAELAKVNDVLAEQGPEAIAYDIIFLNPSDPASDNLFAKSIKQAGNVYLPLAFGVSEQQRAFSWREGISYIRLREDYLQQPLEKGNARPVYAVKALMQSDVLAEAAYNSGHINAPADPDGVYRHHPMLLKIDTHYIPTLSLSIFLDFVAVSLEQVIVEWGKEIRIPATQDSFLEQDVVIPIDKHGRTYIPFTGVWGEDFKRMFMHNLLEHAKDANIQGNLASFFGGHFVFIGDVSQGMSDIGKTPFEDNVPLIAIHTALLNGLLTNSLYKQWTLWHVILLICGIAIVLGASALPKPVWVIYLTGLIILLGLIGFTWYQWIHRTLFPIVTTGGSVLFLFVGLIIGREVATFKERVYIRHAFAKYVPETVVDELLVHPEKLTLGGEKRRISILFSDLQGFTSISEGMSEKPEDLVDLLNEYLTEMTRIVIEAGGTIDKYQGDAIMAEFGAPLPVPNHADMAVSAALKMQRRLVELHSEWEDRKLPKLKCRIGIHTGEVILGNMGSDQVFDYTVIGDNVNLASRLEGANKNYNTFLMISESTYQELSQGRFLTRALDVIKVKGKTETVKVFEVYGETSDSIDPQVLKYYQTYQAGFEAYLAKDFTRAHIKLAQALQLKPEDPAAKSLILRLVELNPHELPQDWDGSVALTSK